MKYFKILNYKKLKQMNKNELIKVIYKKLDKINYLNKTIYAHIADGNARAFKYYKKLYEKDLTYSIINYLGSNGLGERIELKKLYYNGVLNSELINTFSNRRLIFIIDYLNDYAIDIVNDFIDYRDN